MKKKTSIIIFALVALVLIGGVTYAVFVQSSTAKSTSIVAKWRFKVNKNKESFDWQYIMVGLFDVLEFDENCK